MRGRLSIFELGPVSLVALGAFSLFCGATPADAQITSITYSISTGYGGVQSFGSVGPYQEFVTGVANGAVDPRDPLNAVIHRHRPGAPLDANGLVAVLIHAISDPDAGRREQGQSHLALRYRQSGQ